MLTTIAIIFVISAILGISIGIYITKNCECSDEEDYEAKTWGLGDGPEKGR